MKKLSYNPDSLIRSISGGYFLSNLGIYFSFIAGYLNILELLIFLMLIIMTALTIYEKDRRVMKINLLVFMASSAVIYTVYYFSDAIRKYYNWISSVGTGYNRIAWKYFDIIPDAILFTIIFLITFSILFRISKLRKRKLKKPVKIAINIISGLMLIISIILLRNINNTEFLANFAAHFARRHIDCC